MSDSKYNPLATDTDVGKDATEGLRLWLAGEKVRQAEQRLAGQLGSLQSFETRTTSLLTWSGGALVALAYGGHHQRWPGFGAAISLAACVGLCIWASWPAGWVYAGYTPTQIREWVVPNELAARETTADGLQNGLKYNDKRLAEFGKRLRWAWRAFGFAVLFELASLFTPVS